MSVWPVTCFISLLTFQIIATVLSFLLRNPSQNKNSVPKMPRALQYDAFWTVIGSYARDISRIYISCDISYDI